jgi:excisionase family DNA binding protein
MKLQIKEICEAQGIKSAYELAKRTKLNMPTAYRAFANDIKQFTPQTLEALCDALQTSPNAIFGYVEPQIVETAKITKDIPNAEKPAKQPVKAKKVATEAAISRADGLLTTDEVAARLNIHPRTVIKYIKDNWLKATKGTKKGETRRNFITEVSLQEYITKQEKQ